MSRMRSVLVARLDGLGDVLLAGPAIRAVAAGLDRGTELVLLCGPEGAPAARMLPGVDRVAVWSCPWILRDAPPADGMALASLREALGEKLPDEAVILTSFHQSPLPLALALRLFGVGRITGASVDFAGSLLDVRLRPGEDFSEDLPEPERALAIAGAAGYRLPADDSGRLAVNAPAEASALTGSGPYLVIHPGATAPARTWPASHAREAVRLLAERGHRVLVTGGPGERELTAQVAGEHGIDLGGLAGMDELAGILAGARLLISGNTGPAHLAAAVGTPVVSLFSPVVPAVRWAPYGVPVELLGRQDAPCRGSRAVQCPVPGHPCLASVSPEEVLEACERLLDREDETGRRARPRERTAS